MSGHFSKSRLIFNFFLTIGFLCFYPPISVLHRTNFYLDADRRKTLSNPLNYYPWSGFDRSDLRALENKPKFMPLKIFISTVTKEFHRTAPAYRVKFTSYRDLLALHLRREFKGCQIVVQEELVQGSSDLLATLDQEIQSCDFEVHIIGDAAGARPRENELEKLRARHPGFLDSYQKLKDYLLDWSQVSYTQWEAYLAFHHDNKRLIFKAEPSAPRNPEYIVDSEEKETQVAHLARIRSIGEHYQGFYSQADLVIKTIRSILTSQSFTPSTTVDAKELACRVEAVLRKKSKEPPASYDPSRINQYFQAVAEAATEVGLDRSTAIRILDEYSRLRKEALESESAIEAHRELAELALANGKYQEAIIQARSWIDKATQILSLSRERFESTRELLLDGYQYWHDAAVLSGNLEEAVIAVKDGLRHIDRDAEPIAWADFMEPLFRSAMASRDYELADDVLDSIIDIREEHQAGSLELAKALGDWSEILFQKGYFKGAGDVAARVLSREFSSALKSERAFALFVQNKYGLCLLHNAQLAIAENVLRETLAGCLDFYGSDHFQVASSLHNLASVLSETDRIEEAEKMFRQSIGIQETLLGPDHPDFAIGLNNLAAILNETNRVEEAEALLRRTLSIMEAFYGLDNINVVTCLCNLATLYARSKRVHEAETLFRRSITTLEPLLGPNHPDVGSILNNLATLLADTNRSSEAELLYRRSLGIREDALGPNHPDVAASLNNIVSLLISTDRKPEAEALCQRSMEILLRFRESTGRSHPMFEQVAANFVQLTNELLVSQLFIGRACEEDESQSTTKPKLPSNPTNE